MSSVFPKIVSMSISASWLVLAVLLLRLIMKKAPKWVSVLLWGLVAIRLICPFSFESRFSLAPDPAISEQVISNVGAVQIGETTSVLVIDPSTFEESQQPVTSFPAQPNSILPPKTIGNTIYPVLGWIWVTGMVAMLIYTAVSYLLLRRRVSTAVWFGANVYQSEYVDSPFVLGILKPKIYLPFRIKEENLAHVIAHEDAHIRRKDHWWKPLGFLLLAMHWFNPLMWLGYILLCRDIELACDEKVIKEMDNEAKASYSEALVVCSVHRRRIAACPLAFGEVGVKERVKSVMNYKKPAFWIILTAVVICIAVAICFLTTPTDGYGFGIQSIRGGTYTENNRTPCIELDYFLLLDGDDYLSGGRWISQLSEDEPEYTKNGTIPYDGSLGQYRMMLKFPKTGPSANFRKNHKEGNIYTLEGVPGKFENQIQYKAIYPEDGGLIIYFGSDIPFLFKEPGMYNTRYLRGPVQIRLYGVAEPEPPTPTYSHEALTWFEFQPETMDWDTLCETTVDVFPDVTFRASPEAMEAVTPQGKESLYVGMPIWNTFFYDMTEDGYPELCSTVSMGSGIVDTHIVVYDYVKKEAYRLMDRGNFDYHLRLDKQYGGLLVDKHRYMDPVILTTDKLVFIKDTLYLAQDATHTISHSKDEIAQTITTDFKTYYQLKNGKWMSDTGVLYQYRLEITGRMPNAAVDSTFVYLSNLESIPFERAWKAAGLSSNTNDYFEMGEAVLVEWRTGNGSPADQGDHLTAKPETKLDAAITAAIREYYGKDKPDGLLNTESHVILVNETISGTPLAGQTGHIQEQIVDVFYLYQPFRIQGSQPFQLDSIYGSAILVFTVDEMERYTLKHFIKPEASTDPGVEFSAELKERFVSASEKLAENEQYYTDLLMHRCTETVIDYLENLKGQASAQPGGDVTDPFPPSG